MFGKRLVGNSKVKNLSFKSWKCISITLNFSITKPCWAVFAWIQNPGSITLDRKIQWIKSFIHENYRYLIHKKEVNSISQIHITLCHRGTTMKFFWDFWDRFSHKANHQEVLPAKKGKENSEFRCPSNKVLRWKRFMKQNLIIKKT